MMEKKTEWNSTEISSCNSLKELLELQRNVESEIRQTKQKMKLLVYENYEKLVENMSKLSQVDSQLCDIQKHLANSFFNENKTESIQQQ